MLGSTTSEMKQDILGAVSLSSNFANTENDIITRLEQEVVDITGIGDDNTTMSMGEKMATFHFGMGLQLQILRTIDETPDVVNPEEKRVQMGLKVLEQITSINNNNRNM